MVEGLATDWEVRRTKGKSATSELATAVQPAPRF
jgi:hypothetical protein